MKSVRLRAPLQQKSRNLSNFSRNMSQKNAADDIRGGPFAHFATNVIHKGQEPEQWGHHQVIPPISMSTTFKQDVPGEPKFYDYSRAGNPTRDCLERCLAPIENAKGCRVFASGMATTSAIANRLKTGDHIVCCDDVYGGSQRFFRRVSCNHGIEVTMVDMTDLDSVKNAFKPNTKLVWIESPTNPLLKVIDIAAVVKLSKTNVEGVSVIVDNTFMTPYFQRPLDLGADVTLHSITKYINGHSDVIMGCAMTNDDSWLQHLSFMQLAVGTVPSPFECFLVNRGVKTLHLRMQQHMSNALAVARFLETHPKVVQVLYPELPSHPQHEIHKRQTKGMSGMVSFYLKGGLTESQRFFKHVKLFILAESLGGYESLCEIPSVMTHASVPAEERAKLGITDNLIRLSVGCEDGTDLIADLDQALNKAVPN